MSSVHRSKRCVGESSLRREFENMSVSRILARNVSHKLKKKSYREGGEEERFEKGVSSGCLGFHGRGGGCKVGVDTCEDFDDGCGKRKSNAGEDGKRYQPICGSEEARVRVDCFSYGVWKRSCRKEKAVEDRSNFEKMEIFLPDDILEMCLVRLPLATLMSARLVCKKWRSLTSTDRFMQVRRDHQKPWLFVFGVVKDGYCSGKIHVLDSSLDRWHKINADVLKGRFLFSVAAMGDDIYVVGGCSSLINFGRVDKSSFKTHKGVSIFNPLTKSWRKVAPMKAARSSPILGVFEVNSGSTISSSSHKERHDRLFTRTRVGGVSDVYEDPHRLSLRRRHGDNAIEQTRSSNKPVRGESTSSNSRGSRRLAMIVVGGLGSWDEPLDSGEIYDPVSNKWIEMARLPGDFGVVCSGTVCRGLFYVYSESDKLAAYDIDKHMWTRIQFAQSPPRLREYHPKIISSNGRLLMLSVSWCEQNGQSGWREKAVRKLWELDVLQLSWREISRHPDAPMDWNSAFVEDRGKIYGIEMFKIFGQVLDFLTVFDTSDSRLGWSRMTRKHVAHELDAASCITKSLAVLHM